MSETKKKKKSALDRLLDVGEQVGKGFREMVLSPTKPSGGKITAKQASPGASKGAITGAEVGKKKKKKSGALHELLKKKEALRELTKD